MREEDLRSVLLVKAIEEVDLRGAVLSPAERSHATRETMRELGMTSEQADSGIDDAKAARALGARARRLVGPLAERHPIVPEVLGRTRIPGWIRLLLLLVAFASGFGLAALDGSRRINILAFPFLGLIAWNLVAYLALAMAWVKGMRRAKPEGAAPAGWMQWSLARRAGPLIRRISRVDAVLGKAIGAYAASWVSVGGAFMARHAQRWLHFAAALVALGLIVGLFLRGTVLRYEAGWESTFLGPVQVNALLHTLYGPVAGWSGVPLPATLEAVEALRWTGTGGGGDAAPWIKLIALSLACYVVLPRLLLAGLATLSLAQLGRARALPEALRPYAASVFRGGGHVRAGGITSVTPYAYEASAASLSGLERWLEGRTGGDVRLDLRTTLRYGEEDMAGPAFDFGAYRVADLHVVLMNLAATPEAENHGVVIAAARDSARKARPVATVRVVVDESPYLERLARDSSLAARIEERRRLWRDFVAAYGLEADLVALAECGDAGRSPETNGR